MAAEERAVEAFAAAQDPIPIFDRLVTEAHRGGSPSKWGMPASAGIPSHATMRTATGSAGTSSYFFFAATQASICFWISAMIWSIPAAFCFASISAFLES
jgi:hypothetical protein